MRNKNLLLPSNSQHFLFMLIISALYIINFMFGGGVLMLMIVGMLCLYLVNVRESLLLPTMLFLSFFTELMVYGDYQLTIFVYLVFFARAIFSKSGKTKYLIPVFFIYLVLHVYSTSSVKLSQIIQITSFFLVLPASAVYTERQSRDCVTYFGAGFLITSFYGLMRAFIPNLDSALRSDKVVSSSSILVVDRFSGICYDCNFYTIFALLFVYFIFFKVLTLSKELPSNMRTMGFVLLSIASLFGLMTISKSFILCFAVILAYYFYASNGSGKIRYLMVLPLVIVLAFVFVPSLSTIVDAFYDRFEAIDDMNSATSGRSDLWDIYWEDILNADFTERLFGFGMVTKGRNAAHNTWIQLLYDFGIIGLLLDVWILFKSYVNIKGRFKASPYSFVLFVMVFILLWNLSVYTFPSAWAIFVITFILCSKRNLFYPRPLQTSYC